MYWLNASASWTFRVNGEGEFQPTLDPSSVSFLQQKIFLPVVDIILLAGDIGLDLAQASHASSKD